MNCKLIYFSEKFAKHGYLENTRPATTIENLNTRGDVNLAEKNVNVKRGKSCNLEADGIKVGAHFLHVSRLSSSQ